MDKAKLNLVENVLADRDQRIAELERTLQEIKDWIPACTCAIPYKSRNLIDPNCCYHNHFEEIEEIAANATKDYPTNDQRS